MIRIFIFLVSLGSQIALAAAPLRHDEIRCQFRWEDKTTSAIQVLDAGHAGGDDMVYFQGVDEAGRPRFDWSVNRFTGMGDLVGDLGAGQVRATVQLLPGQSFNWGVWDSMSQPTGSVKCVRGGKNKTRAFQNLQCKTKGEMNLWPVAGNRVIIYGTHEIAVPKSKRETAEKLKFKSDEKVIASWEMNLLRRKVQFFDGDSRAHGLNDFEIDLGKSQGFEWFEYVYGGNLSTKCVGK